MPEVIKAGKIPIPDRWWVGVDQKCPRCGCVFHLTAEDPAPGHSGPMGYSGPHFTDCPMKDCQTKVIVNSRSIERNESTASDG